MSDRLRRALTTIGIVSATGAAAWWAWPRPALLLRISRGGQGEVVDAIGRTSPLPETLFVAARGRNTKIRVENRDTTYQTLGMFGVAANSTRTFSVPLPGVYGGFCSAHATSGRITYVIR